MTGGAAVRDIAALNTREAGLRGLAACCYTLAVVEGFKTLSSLI